MSQDHFLKTHKSVHYVNGHNLFPPWPEGMETAIFGMGCFWGVERLFWQQEGVYVTTAGYCGGTTENPSYQEVCTGTTGHAEVVRIIFDPSVISYTQLLSLFWSHHPHRNIHQNDIGTQYRPCIFAQNEAQKIAAQHAMDVLQKQMKNVGIDTVIRAEIHGSEPFYPAEDYHQQYLAKQAAYDEK